MKLDLRVPDWKAENSGYRLRIPHSIFRKCFKPDVMLAACCLTLILAGSSGAHLPMETEYAETLPKDGWEVRLHAGYMDMSKGKDNGMTEQMYSLKLGYGLTRDLSFYIEPTYKVREMSMLHGGIHLMKENSSGVGDTGILARYRFGGNSGEGGSTRQAMLLGVELPTGAWNLIGDNGRLADMVQPGTGSVNYRAGTAMTSRKGNLTINGDLIYRVNTENQAKNQAGYKFGNLISYDLAGLYQIEDLYIMLELNGRLAEKDEVNGIKEDNSGGHQVFATPGFSYHILPDRQDLGTLMLMFSVQLPVYADMNGNALMTNYHVMGGMHWFY